MRLTSLFITLFVAAQNAMGCDFYDGTFSHPIDAPPPAFHKQLSRKLTSDHIHITEDDIAQEALQRRADSLKFDEPLVEDEQYNEEKAWVRWALTVNLAKASPTSLDLSFFHPLLHLSVLSCVDAKGENGAHRLTHLGLHVNVLTHNLFGQDSALSKYLSQNTFLTSLRLYGDFSEEVCNYLKSFPYLTHLDLYVSSFEQESTDSLIDILSKTNEDGSYQLRHLGVHTFFLESFALNTKGTTMRSNNKLFESLRLYGDFNQQRCEGLASFPSLMHLDLSRVVFRSETTPTLITYIKDTPSLISFKAPTPSKEKAILRPFGMRSPLSPQEREKCYEQLTTIEQNYILKPKRLLGTLLSFLADPAQEGA